MADVIKNEPETTVIESKTNASQARKWNFRQAREWVSRTRRHWAEKITFERVSKGAEFLSFLALIFGVPYGLADLHSKAQEDARMSRLEAENAREAAENARKERVEAAEKVYQTVDARYTEFVKLCIDHPRLDCYSLPRADHLKLTEDQKIQQKMLFTELTDVFEVAFVQYHKQESNPEIKKLYDAQWAGWDAYMRKFLKRSSYLVVWEEIKDEYDADLVKYVDSLVHPQNLMAANQTVKQRD